MLIGAAAFGWSGVARAERTIYSFPASVQLTSDLAADRDGNLYGLTVAGNGTCTDTSCGTIYRLVRPTAPGERWTEQTLYSFPLPDPLSASGFQPLGQPWLDAAGNIYGTSAQGGILGSQGGRGTIWQLSPSTDPGGAWRFSVLYTFTGQQDGAEPGGGLVMDASGTLYGTTQGGGTSAQNGVVFALTPPPPGGIAWTETVLHRFGSRGDAIQPTTGPLVLSSHQTVLTGVSWEGTDHAGQYVNGAVFQLRRHGGAWSYHLVYEFPGSSPASAPLGNDPWGPVVVDANGNTFGATRAGGAAGYGVIFELSPPAPGQSAWTERILHTFTGPDGAYPLGGLIAGGSPPALFGGTDSGGEAGAADGTTGKYGVVFRLDPPATGTGPWTYTVLHAFDARPRQVHGGGVTGTLTWGFRRFLFGLSGLGNPNGTAFVLSPHGQ